MTARIRRTQINPSLDGKMASRVLMTGFRFASLQKMVMKYVFNFEFTPISRPVRLLWGLCEWSFMFSDPVQTVVPVPVHVGSLTLLSAVTEWGVISILPMRLKLNAIWALITVFILLLSALIVLPVGSAHLLDCIQNLVLASAELVITAQQVPPVKHKMCAHEDRIALLDLASLYGVRADRTHRQLEEVFAFLAPPAPLAATRR